MRILARRPRLAILALACVVLGGATFASDVGSTAIRSVDPLLQPQIRGDFTVLTYNVKGLPWPAASGRPAALRLIGDQLMAMRKAGVQPDVVLLQEAFVADAKAIGAKAGYRYSVTGPDQAMANSLAGSGKGTRRWYIGETQGKQLDSGLVILSDFPLSQVRRAVFGPDHCAGLDCLAAKGTLLARVAISAGRHVTIATTHLNSAGASKAPRQEADAAFGRQTRGLVRFVQEHWNRSDPLVLAGDFNVGRKPRRAESLSAATRSLGAASSDRNALLTCLHLSDCKIVRQREAEQIGRRAKDMQMITDGRLAGLEPVSASIPFPVANGLSDHAGFMIGYRFIPMDELSR